MLESAFTTPSEPLPRNHRLDLHKNVRRDRDESDTAFGVFTYLKPNGESLECRYEASAVTLGFIRGAGKIAMNGSLAEYGGKWFEIPRSAEYKILPETETVMLTILKPLEDADELHSGGNII
jgi:hypothetical protein